MKGALWPEEMPRCKRCRGRLTWRSLADSVHNSTSEKLDKFEWMRMVNWEHNRIAEACKYVNCLVVCTNCTYAQRTGESIHE